MASDDPFVWAWQTVNHLPVFRLGRSFADDSGTASKRFVGWASVHLDLAKVHLTTVIRVYRRS